MGAEETISEWILNGCIYLFNLSIYILLISMDEGLSAGCYDKACHYFANPPSPILIGRYNKYRPDNTPCTMDVERLGTSIL